LCVLGGCFSDEAGLHIIVRDKSGRATNVDMYIVDHVSDVAAMTPMGTNTQMTGTVLVLDSDDPPTNGVLHDGEFVFNILPRDSSKALELPKVMFIGRDGQGAVSYGDMRPLPLDAGGSVAYIVDLQEDAFPVTGPSDVATPSGTRIFEWDNHGGSTPRAKCTDVEFAEDATNGQVLHYFFVPPDDPDCDGAIECRASDEYVYGTSPVQPPLPPASLDNVQCAQKDVENGDTVCRLGVKTTDVCDETGEQVCTPFTAETFCAPLSVCANSACLDNPNSPDECFPELPGPVTAASGSFLDCSIPATLTGAVCGGVNPSQAVVALGPQLMTQFSLQALPSCQSIQVWHPNIPLLPALASNTFVQSLTRAHPRFTAIASVTSQCAFTLVYGGGASTQDYATGGLDVEMHGNRHVIVPVRVTFIGCDDGMGGSSVGSCRLVSQDVDLMSLKECLNP
jgi:hypothetical protein